jgi:hypothetical protein
VRLLDVEELIYTCLVKKHSSSLIELKTGFYMFLKLMKHIIDELASILENVSGLEIQHMEIY